MKTMIKCKECGNIEEEEVMYRIVEVEEGKHYSEYYCVPCYQKNYEIIDDEDEDW